MQNKYKRSIAVRNTPHRYGNSRVIFDHTTTFPPLSQPKLILD